MIWQRYLFSFFSFVPDFFSFNFVKEETKINISACKDGQYISNRTCVSCKGHCKDGSPCNKLTGRCDNGCSNQWTGEYCECMYIYHKHFKYLYDCFPCQI